MTSSPRAEDRASERMALPELCGEEVMDQVVGRVLHHLDLLEHNRLFALELLGVEDRVQEDVGQEIDRERQVLVEHLDRSEEHTSELQSRLHLVCRLLL